MPNLDIIYDVTTEVTWNERKTNKQVIYQTASLPSFVTFDAFYFCLWPKTLSLERHLGGKALATDHRGSNINAYDKETLDNLSSAFIDVLSLMSYLGIDLYIQALDLVRDRME